MRTYKILFFLFYLSGSSVIGQTIEGMVADSDHSPLPGATVQLLGSNQFTVTNENGRFSLDVPSSESMLVVSYVGYTADTVQVTPGVMMHIMLDENVELQEVVIKSAKTFVDPIEPRHYEVITELELQKAACCNLAESFETNASVDVSFADAVSGTRQIRMLGLDGKYVQIQRENMPAVRGLISSVGVSYIPGTWIQSIDVGKGAGSVVNGYESMSGQLNLEYKKPGSEERLYLNGYVNGMGRSELNANFSTDLSEKWSTAVLGHVNYLNTANDRNGDGFLDVPRSGQFNILNRYEYDGDRVYSQFGFHIMEDNRVGGQVDFQRDEDPLTSSLYGMKLRSRRFEFFGKTGLLFLQKPYKGWGFQYSGTRQELDGAYGRTKYIAEENTGYFNAIYQNIIGNSFHQYRLGASVLVDDFNENLQDSLFSRTEVVPGMFLEYTQTSEKDYTLVAGIRADYNNLFGWFVSPRLHFRWQPQDPTVFRISAGKGYRVANPVAENNQLLASNRQFVFTEALRPETSWNLGTSITQEIWLKDKPLTLVGDFFYTTFQNQVVVDRDASTSEVQFYNLSGRSYASSFQIEAGYELMRGLSAKGAYKFYRVVTDYRGAGERSVPFTPQDRFFLNLEYATFYDKWKVDWTGQWYGSQRIPDTYQNPEPFTRPGFSPTYFVMNAQVLRGFRWGSVYIGAENLLNFRQLDPILDPADPFGPYFDATLVWGPVEGRRVYAGIRYKLIRRK